MIRRIAIVGTGLIGGSLGLAWKERRPSLHIIGWDKPSVLEIALRRGAIDEAAPSLAYATRQSDLIVLCVPISAMATVLQEISPHIETGTLVTDVGSVKQPVIRAANHTLPESVTFIGGHPMAGSAHSGIEHADGFLFENATYVLCGDTAETEYQTISEILEFTGARIICLQPEEHDIIAARVSHLPQLLATMLMNVVASESEDNDATLRLAAGGFRDMTRIASSSFDVWQPILDANRVTLLPVLHNYIEALQNVFSKLSNDNITALYPIFSAARRARSKIPKNYKGFLQPLCDVFVYLEDRPGTLSRLTNVLFTHGINIKDIELLKIREGTGGAFRISFVDEASADAAVNLFNTSGYRAHRLG